MFAQKFNYGRERLTGKCFPKRNLKIQDLPMIAHIIFLLIQTVFMASVV